MILENALILALMTYFVKASTWEGMIFHKPYKWFEKRLPEKIFKPFLGCPVCMEFWWGIFFYNLADYLRIEQFTDNRFQIVAYTIFVGGGINTVILMLNKLYDVFKDIDKGKAIPVSDETR